MVSQRRLDPPRIGAIPIVGNESPSREGSGRAVDLARQLLDEQPKLSCSEPFRRCLFRREESTAAALHLDDYPVVDKPVPDRILLELRARLRAGDGDLIATHSEPDSTVEDYFADRLGLGRPQWLVCGPRTEGRVERLATRCWTEARHRSTLIDCLGSGPLLVHPYQSYVGAWHLGHLLSRAGEHDARVVGPPFRLADAVNNKVWFSNVVQRLFGRMYLPPTRTATSLSTATVVARDLATRMMKIVIKLPSSSGGLGNLVFDSGELSGSPGETRQVLRRSLDRAGWNGEELLVSGWETNVYSSPSIQLWIPPVGQGEPIVEGVFEQLISGRQGNFLGCRPARLGERLRQEITDSGWLLGFLFQHLGYIGRCSFDYLVVGPNHCEGKLEFLECNGRWGGTSLPMSLVNRLVGNWAERPFLTRQLRMPGLERLHAEAILDAFEDDLYDRRTDKGWLVFTNLGASGYRPWVSALALAAPGEGAEDLAGRFDEEFPARLRDLARGGRR